MVKELLSDGDSCLSILYDKDAVAVSTPPQVYSIKILLDIGYIVCVNEETLSNVIASLFSSSRSSCDPSSLEEIQFDPDEIASLLVGMANSPVSTDLSTQLLL